MKLFILMIFMIVFSSCAGKSDYSLNDLSKIRPKGNVELKIYIFDTGHMDFRDLSIINTKFPKGGAREMIVPSYLIVHPKGTLLWDAGLSDTLHQYKGGLEMYGGLIHSAVPKTLKAQLEEIDIAAAKVKYVAFSHFHNDHTGNAGYFKNATLLLQESVYELAFSDNAVQNGYNPDDYASFRKQSKKLKGHYDVFGDDSVIIIATPGHTIGHQVLYLDLPKTGPVLLSGDLYIMKEQHEQFWIPKFNKNKKETIHSYSMIEKFLERTNAKLWIQHDINQFRSMKLSPEFYD